METVSYLLVGALIIYVIIFVVIKSEVESRTLEKKVAARRNEAVILTKKNEPDFYGTNLLKSDPENFMRKLEQKKQQLAKGESVGVNAAEAFYLIRNSAHKDLIVGEDGTINMKDLNNSNYVVSDESVEELKNKILNFQPAGRDKNAKPKVMQIPGYVKEVQQIKDGATRWVFEDWHAKECGIKTLCWDRFGRAMLDLDEIKEDQKNKSGKKDSGKGSRNSDELTDLSKKMSRVLEMEEERRADAMLSTDEQGSTSKSFFEYHNKERFLTHTAMQNNFIDSVLRSVFSEQGAKDIFVRFSEKEIFIEKNYFARCVRDLFFENERRQFDLDFMTNSIAIYDGNKINEILQLMNANEYFIRVGQGAKRMLFNMLFSSEDIDRDYYAGWYIKMELGAHNAIMEFLNHNGINVEIVASETREIARRVKILGNVKKSY